MSDPRKAAGLAPSRTLGMTDCRTAWGYYWYAAWSACRASAPLGDEENARWRSAEQMLANRVGLCISVRCWAVSCGEKEKIVSDRPPWAANMWQLRVTEGNSRPHTWSSVTKLEQVGVILCHTLARRLPLAGKIAARRATTCTCSMDLKRKYEH